MVQYTKSGVRWNTTSRPKRSSVIHSYWSQAGYAIVCNIHRFRCPVAGQVEDAWVCSVKRSFPASGDPFMLPALYIGLWVHSTPILYFSFDSAYDIGCTAAISRSTALSFRIPLRNDPMGDPFVAVVILALCQPACASPFQTFIQAASAWSARASSKALDASHLPTVLISAWLE